MQLVQAVSVQIRARAGEDGVAPILGDLKVLSSEGDADPAIGLQPRGLSDAVTQEPRAVVEEQVVLVTTAVAQG